ncbi:MAG: hypothetical protein WA667_13930 [Candidatus Nitrosopolaris sp.]
MEYTRMQSKSKWVTSEFKSGNNGKYYSINVSLQPRIDAIRNHITEQIIELERIMCQSISNEADITRNKDLHVLKNDTVYYSGASQHLSKRKLNQITHLSKILLERLANQLSNVSDLGDLVIILSPAVAVLKNIRSLLIPCLPDSSQELGYICELLEVVLVDAAQLGGYTINFQTANESALQLITEASLNKGGELISAGDMSYPPICDSLNRD